MSASWHHEQTWPGSCVPSCMCIIQKARGQAPTEAAFHGNASGHSPALVMNLPRVRRIPSSADEERELLVELTTGAIVAVVTVLASPYVYWQEKHYPGLISQHGRLAVAGTFGGDLHAIALIERSVDGFAALDPYFPAHPPLQIDDDAFASFFGGHAYIADP